jgi:hypothetical protein
MQFSKFRVLSQSQHIPITLQTHSIQTTNSFAAADQITFSTHTQNKNMAFISLIAVAWIYVVMLMAVTEANQTSIVAGIMTFIFYCVLPLGIVLYILRSPQRKRKLREQGELTHLISKKKDAGENLNKNTLEETDSNKAEDEK